MALDPETSDTQPTAASDPDDDFKQAAAIVGIPVVALALAGAAAIVIAALKHRNDNQD